jgi:putative transcriptional regulator
LKADGRIVELLPDGREKAMDHSDPALFVRHVRARCGLTQAAFAERIEVPLETVRNWEQGKRSPRGPARALLKLIDRAPDTAFAALGGGRR